MTGPKVAIERLLFGYHVKTKRSLAEEAESGDETSLFTWIKDGVDPDEVDAYGYTPLLNAAALGRVNAVYELIRNGANVNKRGPFGFTALHAASQV
jgi:ankyrin repeat protein